MIMLPVMSHTGMCAGNCSGWGSMSVDCRFRLFEMSEAPRLDKFGVGRAGWLVKGVKIGHSLASWRHAAMEYWPYGQLGGVTCDDATTC